ncbi:Pah, partial [Symbiodinium microadriaticum]
KPRVAIVTEIEDRPGALHDLLRYFWKYDIDLTHIESRPSSNGHSGGHKMFMDFYGEVGDSTTDKLLTELRKVARNTLILDEEEVPWFPRHINELDRIANRVLDAGADLEADHPGFHDPVYRARRAELASIALNYAVGTPIPHIKYTEAEINTWGAVYNRLSELQEKYACKEYLTALTMMQRHCGYSSTRIPQAQDISDFLQRRTGFRLRPVAGLLSSRDFLNGLAFRVFFSTQYIRHDSKPLYTPEPDICHELLGHAPMFADPDFADFSQEIGLASLGASDDEIAKLAACYWYSVEFGLVKENGVIKAYGAGLLSSFGELEYSCSPDRPAGGTDDRPELRPWSPAEAGLTQFPITCYQPIYYVAE